MRYLVFLLLLCIGYYYYRKKYGPLPKKYDIYASVFVAIYLLLYYSINKHPDLTYKFANNIKNVHKQPLHTLIPEYKISHNPIKVQLLTNQNFRCNNCKNHFLLSEIEDTKLSYKNFNSSPNDINNIQLLCPRCYNLFR